LGFDAQEVADSVHALMRGLRATTLYEDQQEVETVVRQEPASRETVEQMKDILLVNSRQEVVPLKNVVEVVSDLSPSEIWHKNKARMIQVSANIGSATLEEAAQTAQKLLKQVNFPNEYYGGIGGQYEEMLQASSDFWRALLLCLFLVYLVMACQFESFRLSLIMMGTIPLSMIGAVAAICLIDAPVTMGVSVGFLMLAGIVVNNGIMLIERVKILETETPALTIEERTKLAVKQRLRPIFMTTATTLLGLVPMALDASESASLWSPLAVSVIGGLSVSTVLTLFFLPSLMLWKTKGFRFLFFYYFNKQRRAVDF
jgi:hydrophobic/amphiphilic exporter-1 (mainly G- bacteria), HAE1 family